MEESYNTAQNSSDNLYFYMQGDDLKMKASQPHV